MNEYKKYILLGNFHDNGKKINIKNLFSGKLTSSKLYKELFNKNINISFFDFIIYIVMAVILTRILN